MVKLDGAAAAEDPPIPIIAAPLPFTTRINCAIRLWAFKIFVYIVLRFFRLFKPTPRSMRPTLTKTYPVRPSIVNRVFIPRSYESGNKPLSLYISIHGGGFALCDPQVDDEFASGFANKYGICVVNIGYRLAPLHYFPSQVYDCAAIVQAVIEDESLPVDRQNVVLGGFSAGGNLSLAIAQLPTLKGKIAAIVAFYPVVDFTRSKEQMMKERPFTPGKQDVLQNSSNWFGWGYVPSGTDRRDPLLSPVFAKRVDLPQKLYFIGAEHDMLCKGAEDMAERLAESENGRKETLKSGVGWEKGGIRWEKAMGWDHGFDHVKAKGKREEERLKLTAEVRERVATWLRREVYE